MVHKHILVAIDGSAMERKVIAKAVEEAKLKEASLTVVRILDTPSYLLNSPRLMKMMEGTRKYLVEELASIKQEIAPYGNPKQQIIAYATEPERAIDLIIIGATGESEETLAGSTTTYLINRAPCDVLVVR
jgi:nucleotide-binding universal stress UspA family protein